MIFTDFLIEKIKSLYAIGAMVVNDRISGIIKLK